MVELIKISRILCKIFLYHDIDLQWTSFQTQLSIHACCKYMHTSNSINPNNLYFDKNFSSQKIEQIQIMYFSLNVHLRTICV